MTEASRELQQASRALTRTPVLTAASVLCLALAIGAATAVFSLVDGIVLRPLPFPSAARLVSVWGVQPDRDAVRRGFSWPDIQDAARASRTLDAVAAVANTGGGMTLTGRGDPVRLMARIVSSGVFATLGIAPQVGRVLEPADDAVGSAPAVVLSDATWRRQFAADPAIVGTTIRLDDRPFAVAGIAARGFDFPDHTEIWVTITHGAPDYAANRDVGWLSLVGRMAPGASPDTVHAELGGVFERLARHFHPSRSGESISVVPLDREVLGDTRPAVLALFAAVLVLLVIACANVGGLLLVRSAARARDAAIRVALGATRGALLRQAAAEAALLAGFSGAAGVALAAMLLGIARRVVPADTPRLDAVTLDLRVLGFAVVAAAATALVCAVTPALGHARLDVESVLRRGGRAGSGDRPVIRRALAAGEIALSIVLLVGAGLVGRAFLALRATDVGFIPANVLAFDVPQPSTRYPTAADSRQFADALLARLRTLPDVRQAASILLRPLWGTVGMDWTVTAEGQSPAEAALNPLVNLEAVSPGYFSTMGIAARDGRDFSAGDRADRAPVAIVGESFARRFWPGRSALGRRIRFPLPGSPFHRQWFTVVGVVGDARYRGLTRPRLDLYISAAQSPYPVTQFVVRSNGRPAGLIPLVRASVREIDRDLALDDVVVLSEAVAAEQAGSRLAAAAFVAFGIVATILASLGIGTLTAWEVRQRRRELGIRLALGAPRQSVIRLVMRDGLVIVLAGTAAGLAGTAAVRAVLGALMAGLAPPDVGLISLAVAVAAAAALGSAWAPASRTARIDPIIALRQG